LVTIIGLGSSWRIVKGLSMSVVGIDACKSGWIAVVLRGTSVSAVYLQGVSDLAAEIPDAEVIAIDIPIGLPKDGRRAADIAAKKLLGTRGSTLFHVPVRAALEASSHEEATRISTELTGHGISQQSFALKKKIFEVEEWLPVAPCPVYEVHPEVSFVKLCGSPLTSLKKSWTGMLQRREALKKVGIDLDGVDGDVGRRAAVDDLLDAGVAVWSAGRILEGLQCSLPATPEIGDDSAKTVLGHGGVRRVREDCSISALDKAARVMSSM
jgi:predicted RNase H-like nuclease